MTTDTATIRELVIARARELGYTPDSIATATKVHRTTLYRFFAGTQDLTSARLDEIFRVLEMSAHGKEKIIPENSRK